MMVCSYVLQVEISTSSCTLCANVRLVNGLQQLQNYLLYGIYAVPE